MQIFDQLHDGHHLLSGSGLDKRLHQRGDRGCGQLPHGAVVAGFHALTLPLPRGRVPGMGGAPWEGGAGGGWDRLGGQSWLTAQATVCGDHRVLFGEINKTVMKAVKRKTKPALCERFAERL